MAFRPPAAATPSSRAMNIRVPAEVFAEIARVAERDDRSVSQTAVRLIVLGLKVPIAEDAAAPLSLRQLAERS